jgi:hypothetical protein
MLPASVSLPARRGPALLVAALHGLLFLGLWRLPGWQVDAPTPPEPAAVIVWLPGAPQPRVLPPSAAPPASPRPTPRPALAKRPLPPPVAATAPALAVVEAVARRPAEPAAKPQATTLPTPAREAAADPAPPGTAPLNLELPRGAAAPWRGPNAALEQARQTGSRMTLEDRIAQVLGGSDQVIETRLADGSVRLQRGPHCVIASPSLAGETDPFNASSRMRPRVIRRC